MAELWFLYLALAFIWTHELDALDRHEWRVMPVLRTLPDALAKRIFLWMHVPLMALSAWLIAAGPGSVGAGILAGLCILHVGLHRLFRNHPAYEFQGLESRLLILGAGLFGALYWLTQLVGRTNS